VAAFRDHEIDWEVLARLTSEDLREIGVAAIGHRRKLLDAIAALGASGATAALTAAVSDASASTDAERRQLTVMFCDLVGSTPLSTRFDPEDLREIVGAYHRCVTDTVGRFGGFVAKYMGDGVLIYFGYPEAHEDDAEQAVRAGLAVIDAVGQLTTHGEDAVADVLGHVGEMGDREAADGKCVRHDFGVLWLRVANWHGSSKRRPIGNVIDSTWWCRAITRNFIPLPEGKTLASYP
jgi:hypothetical protein